MLSGGAHPARATPALRAFDEQLWRRDDGLTSPFARPFAGEGSHDPGYVAADSPGLRENGGQYTHAATWAALAYCRLGQGDRAAEFFPQVDPISHAATQGAAARYRVEPNMVAADFYSVPPCRSRRLDPVHRLLGMAVPRGRE